MTDTSLINLFDRINSALTRIEAVAARPKAVTKPETDPRYIALRNRTQAALASLEQVIAQIGPGDGPAEGPNERRTH